MIKERIVFLMLLMFGLQMHYSQDLPEKDKLNPVGTSFLGFKNRLKDAIRKQDTSNIIYNHILLADFYRDLGVTNEAVHHYNEALLFHSKVSDSTHVIILNNLGSINLEADQYAIAKSYLQKSLRLSRTIDFQKGEAVAYASLGAVYEKEGEYDQGLKCQNKSLRLFSALGDYEGLAVVYENIGSIYEDLQQYDKAYTYFKSAYEYFYRVNDDRKISILNNLGDVNRKKGDFEKAFFYTNKAKYEAERTNNVHQLSSALKDLSKTSKLTGDHLKAFDYLNASIYKYKEEQKLRRIQQMNTLQIVYGVKEREAKIALLTKQNELNRANQRTVVFVIFLVIIIFAIVFFNYRKKKDQRFKIEQYKQQLLKADLDKKIAEEESLQREIQIKTSSLSKYSLHLAHKNKVLSDVSSTLIKLKDRERMFIKPKLEGLIAEIKADIEDEQGWVDFIKYFEQIHPDFFKKIHKVTSGNLSTAEMRLCMLLRLSLTSKEIASVLRITPDSIRIARYRLRKKLLLEKGSNLQNFMLDL